MVLTLVERQWITGRARAAGFDLAGVASVPEPTGAEAAENDARFKAWIAAGHAGEMEYLKRQDAAGKLLRGDLRRAMPWARSVLVCAVNYNAAAPRSTDTAEPDMGWIARYAWSGRADLHKDATTAGELGANPCPQVRGTWGTPSDYHDVLLEKLRAVEANLRERFGGSGDELQTRCYVDTGPLLERGYAARAGIGWIGRNTCVLNQQQGSWLLLGVIVTSLELEQRAWSVAAVDRCGSCTRCIDACPTEALLRAKGKDGARQMDASRCIAYLTIEKKGSIDEELRGKMGRQVFGCDICQDVCPWNSKGGNGKSPVAASEMLPVRRELVNPRLEWLAGMDGPEFNRWFRGSPLERTRRRRILRNVAIAMGNSGERKFLPRLAEWAASDDAVLAEAARWAAARLGKQGGPEGGEQGGQETPAEMERSAESSAS